MTTTFHLIWQEQCEAAEGIRERFGVEEAASYLIGEKFLNYLEASDREILFKRQVVQFVARIRDIFDPPEILAALRSVMSEPTDDGGLAFDEIDYEPHDAVMEGERILLIERARELLLT